VEANEMRQDIVDRGIEKGENEMRPVLQSLSEQRTDRGEIADPLAGRVGSNTGQMSSDASDQTGTTPFAKGTGEDLPERAGISRKEHEMHERQVDPKAVRESEKEAELDTTSEPEPGEGKPAA
jgi:hypothetical protein